MSFSFITFSSWICLLSYLFVVLSFWWTASHSSRSSSASSSFNGDELFYPVHALPYYILFFQGLCGTLYTVNLNQSILGVLVYLLAIVLASYSIALLENNNNNNNNTVPITPRTTTAFDNNYSSFPHSSSSFSTSQSWFSSSIIGRIVFYVIILFLVLIALSQALSLLRYLLTILSLALIISPLTSLKAILDEESTVCLPTLHTVSLSFFAVFHAMDAIIHQRTLEFSLFIIGIIAISIQIVLMIRFQRREEEGWTTVGMSTTSTGEHRPRIVVELQELGSRPPSLNLSTRSHPATSEVGEVIERRPLKSPWAAPGSRSYDFNINYGSSSRADEDSKDEETAMNSSLRLLP